MSKFGRKEEIQALINTTYLKDNLEKQMLKFVNKSNNEDPTFAKDGDSGFDLRAWIDCENSNHPLSFDEDGKSYTTLLPLQRTIIHTGLYFELPEFTEIQVRPRSGTSLKQGLVVLNTPGTIDEGYRGEVCVILINLSNSPVNIYNGDRIAQGVLKPVYNSYLTDLVKVGQIDEHTGRGANGFGSTGTK